MDISNDLNENDKSQLWDLLDNARNTDLNKNTTTTAATDTTDNNNIKEKIKKLLYAIADLL